MKAHCRKCGGDTSTHYPKLPSGHIGNLCAVCGCPRLGAPFITRRKFLKLLELKLIPNFGTPTEGERHDPSTVY